MESLYVFGIAQSMRKAVMRQQNLMAQIEKRFGVSWDEVVGPSRERQATYCRQLATLMMREYDMSLQGIGDVLHRHHTTIIASLRKIRALCKYDPEVAEDVAYLRGGPR